MICIVHCIKSSQTAQSNQWNYKCFRFYTSIVVRVSNIENTHVTLICKVLCSPEKPQSQLVAQLLLRSQDGDQWMLEAMSALFYWEGSAGDRQSGSVLQRHLPLLALPAGTAHGQKCPVFNTQRFDRYECTIRVLIAQNYANEIQQSSFVNVQILRPLLAEPCLLTG